MITYRKKMYILIKLYIHYFVHLLLLITCKLDYAFSASTIHFPSQHFEFGIPGHSSPSGSIHHPQDSSCILQQGGWRSSSRIYSPLASHKSCCCRSLVPIRKSRALDFSCHLCSNPWSQSQPRPLPRPV